MVKWIAGIAVIAMVALLGMALVPAYIENHKVTKIATQVVNDPELAKSPRRVVAKRVEELFRTNEVKNLKPEDVVTVLRDNAGELVIDVKYEERRKLVYNLEIVAVFDDQITD